MTNAETIIKAVCQRVYTLADQADWIHLTITQRKNYYEAWTQHPEIGAMLAKTMPAERVRVYLKDTIIGTYCRSKRLGVRNLLRSMSIACDSITQEYIKPEAVLCDKYQLYTITATKDWKISLINNFERAQERRIKRNLLFITEHTAGRFVDHSYRSMIEDAATRLGVEIQ
jgi:hypothetical protein